MTLSFFISKTGRSRGDVTPSDRPRLHHRVCVRIYWGNVCEKCCENWNRLLQKVQALLYIFWSSQLISASSPGAIFRSNHFRQKLDLGSWSRKNHPFNAVPKNDLTCIWAAAVNHMVLIPTSTWFMKCSLGSREHLLGASSTLILRRLICLWPWRMNFLLGCEERVRLLASSRSWLDDCAHLWKSAILMRAGLEPRDRVP